jgi:uncharacterized protein YbjT (DUF2867 family)
MPSIKTALLIGATGLTGSLCLRELIADNYFTYIEAWVRKPLDISHPKLKSILMDFSMISQLPSTTATHIFCCLGTTIRKAGSQEAFREVDYGYVVELAKLAERSHAETFLVISSLGANAGSGNFYLRVKGEMEETIKKCTIPSIIIMRPSMLLGNRPEFRAGEQIGKGLMKAFNFLLVGKLKRYRGIEAATVARAMLTLAKEQSEGTFIVESDHIHKWQAHNK